MDNKNILIIKEDSNDFERFYNNNIKQCGVDVATPDQFRLRKGNKIKKILNLVKSFFILKNEIDIKKYDLIIVFEDVKIIPIIYTHKKRKTKIILWNWNIKTNFQAKQQSRYANICDIWTFDENDSKKYGWKLNNQFYFNIKLPIHNNGDKIKAFLACVDKGRYEVAREIRNALIEIGVECSFWLVKQDNKTYLKEDDIWLKNALLPYDDFLINIENSDIVIDLVQEGQSGITVRILEAIIANKKIITNNYQIIDSELFDSKNIYLWDDKVDKERLKNFIFESKHPYDSSIKEKYMFENWIRNFY